MEDLERALGQALLSHLKIYQSQLTYNNILGSLEIIACTEIDDEGCDLVVKNIAGQYPRFIKASSDSAKCALLTRLYAEDVLELLSSLKDPTSSNKTEFMEYIEGLIETAREYKEDAKFSHKSYKEICISLHNSKDELQSRKKEIQKDYEERRSIWLYLRAMFNNSEKRKYEDINKVINDLREELDELAPSIGELSLLWINIEAEIKSIGEKYGGMKKRGKVNDYELNAIIKKWKNILKSSRKFSDDMHITLAGREEIIEILKL